MESSPFHLVAKANAAKGFGVRRGFVAVDGLTYLAAATNEPVKQGTFRLPVRTTSHLVIDRVTGALPDDMWVSFHTDDAGVVDAEGTRLSVAGSLQPGGSDRRWARVAPWFDGEALALESVDGRDGARLRLAKAATPIDFERPKDEPQRRCLDTFRASHFSAQDTGAATAAGSCEFDAAPSRGKRKLAVLRFVPHPVDSAAPRLIAHAEPLPGTHQEDRVTGLVVRSEDEVLVSVVRRGRSKEPARIYRRTEIVWDMLRTPIEAPAISMSATDGGPLWVASPSEMWRHLGKDRWERVPLPSVEVMQLQRAPNISTLWVSGPDDVWAVVAHGARVLRTKRPTAPLTLGTR